MVEQRDIVIAGGGMVGVSLALQLAASLPDSTRICLVEGHPFPSPTPGRRPEYHPAFDARSTALSYSSRLIYERLGVWEDLAEWLCPIRKIHVSSRGRFGSAIMDAEAHNWPALGYVVENAWLGNALLQFLHRQGRVELRSPCKVVGVHTQPDAVQVTLDGDAGGTLEAGLLVVADGAGSGLREALGVSVQEKPYGQHALIANLATAQPHQGCAYERFTRQGPIAMLPLLGVEGAAHRSALVWTLDPPSAQAMQAAAPADFLATLQEQFGYRLGRLTAVGERHAYPLSLVQSVEQVRRGVVVMGNAAHALHPVAGQGFNLALRDVAELTRVLVEAGRGGEPLGALAVLQRYEQRQRADQQRTIEASDRLPSLFMQTDPVVGLARDLALSGLDLLPALKRGFIDYAAGVAALGERP